MHVKVTMRCSASLHMHYKRTLIQPSSQTQTASHIGLIASCHIALMRLRLSLCLCLTHSRSGMSLAASLIPRHRLHRLHQSRPIPVHPLRMRQQGCPALSRPPTSGRLRTLRLFLGAALIQIWSLTHSGPNLLHHKWLITQLPQARNKICLTQCCLNPLCF